MMPPCSHTGTPRHFHVSTTSGSAALISARMRPSIWPRQSPSSLMRASISCAGDLVFAAALLATTVSSSLQIGHLVERPDFDLARPHHRIGATLHPSDRLCHVLDFPD